METLGVELQLNSVAENGYFAGYASVFDLVDKQQDIILAGAFSAAIEEPQSVKLLWQHDVNQPIGRIEYMEEDGHGLYVEARLLLDVQKARRYNIRSAVNIQERNERLKIIASEVV